MRAQTIVRCKAKAVSKLILFAQVLIDRDSWAISKIQTPALAVLTDLNPRDHQDTHITDGVIGCDQGIVVVSRPHLDPSTQKIAALAIRRERERHLNTVHGRRRR